MKTAVDTSVLLDVLTSDAIFGPRSREALRRAYDLGSLVASDVVWSEVRAHFESDTLFESVMDGLGLQYLPLSDEAARLAGAYWRAYHQTRHSGSSPRTEVHKRVVADFLVGAHAQLQADALLARDRGFFRGYFKELRLLEP
jgi:predicted nucleic acid-binding protein